MEGQAIERDRLDEVCRIDVAAVVKLSRVRLGQMRQSKLKLCLQPSKQNGQSHVQSLSNSQNGSQSGFPCPTFKITDMNFVHSRMLGQVNLPPALLFP
jgi:hypothetical protein